MNDNDNDDICSICLDKLVNNIKTIECKHKFHNNCLDEWLKHADSCPYCRTKLNKPNQEITNFIINMNQREAGNLNYINIYAYSFNLHPESYEPSGTANFSNIYR